MKPLQKQTKTSTVLERLRHDLVCGYFAPGEKLPMELLKERYQVGYSPLREALSRLVTHGLVQVEALCGFYVPQLSLEELYDLYNVRIQIDTLALELSIEFGDEEWESDVIACWQRYENYLLLEAEQSSDPILWDNLQKELCYTLIKACRSPWLLKIHDMLYDHTARYRFLCIGRHYHDKQLRAEFYAELEQLVAAVLARNKEQAIQISQEGWDKSLQSMTKSLQATRVTSP